MRRDVSCRVPNLLPVLFMLSSCGDYQTMEADLEDVSLVGQEHHSPARRGEFREINVRLPFYDRLALVAVEVTDGVALLEGDIIVASMDELGPGVYTPQGVALNNTRRLWPDGVIPYAFSNGYPSASRSKVDDALASLGRQTNLSFVRRGNQQDYVEVQNGNGCSSAVGRVGGRQRLSLNVPGCVHTGVVQHEFLHAAGFYHEQSRYDRDDYVTIYFENIKDGMEGNFRRVSNPSYDIGSYDFSSIMHICKHVPEFLSL